MRPYLNKTIQKEGRKRKKEDEEGEEGKGKKEEEEEEKFYGEAKAGSNEASQEVQSGRLLIVLVWYWQPSEQNRHLR